MTLRSLSSVTFGGRWQAVFSMPAGNVLGYSPPMSTLADALSDTPRHYTGADSVKDAFTRAVKQGNALEDPTPTTMVAELPFVSASTSDKNTMWTLFNGPDALIGQADARIVEPKALAWYLSDDGPKALSAAGKADHVAQVYSADAAARMTQGPTGTITVERSDRASETPRPGFSATYGPFRYTFNPVPPA